MVFRGFIIYDINLYIRIMMIGGLFDTIEGDDSFVYFFVYFVDQFRNDLSPSELFFSPNLALPFFISTFGTSFIWFLFVITALFARAASQNSRILESALRVISESSAPARTTVGIFVAPFGLIFLISLLLKFFGGYS